MKLNPKLLLDMLYPIGSIYINTTGINPGTFLGGTWASFGSGRCLVGQDTQQNEFDTLEETGGEKTHKLTTNEMPSHNHSMIVVAGAGQPISTNWGIGSASNQCNNNISSLDRGGDQAHNNLQPYIVVSMWKRTA